LLTNWQHPTCPSQNVLQAGSAAAAASVRKTTKYSTLSANQRVFPVAVETLRPLSDEAHSLIAEIGRRATHCTADPRETTFLCQCTWQFSVSMQCALPTRSQSPSPHCNHSGHTVFANFKTLGMKYEFLKCHTSNNLGTSRIADTGR